MNTLFIIAQEAGLIGRRAKRLLTGDNVLYLVQELGLELEATTYAGSTADYDGLRTSIAQALVQVQALIQAAQALEAQLTSTTMPDATQLAELALHVYEALSSLLTQFEAVKTALASLSATTSGPTQAALTAFAQTFTQALTNLLLLSHLRSFHSRFYAVLLLLGIVRDKSAPLLAATALPEADKILDLTALTAFLRSPATFLTTYYGWGTSDFAYRRLLISLREVAVGMGIPVYFEPEPYDLTSVPVLHLNSFLAIQSAVDTSYAFDVVLTAPALQKTLPLPINLAGWELR